jgi:uncharacterized protein (TIGR03435 family)
MLQNLLVERFQLKFHYKNSEAAGCALTVVRNGSELQASKERRNAPILYRVEGRGDTEDLSGPADFDDGPQGLHSYAVNPLSAVGGRGPGVDKTNLNGRLRLHAFLEPRRWPGPLNRTARAIGFAPGSCKVPVSMFVVDFAQKPSAN